jgi:hypothetical protein
MTAFMNITIFYAAGPDIQFARPCIGKHYFPSADLLPKAEGDIGELFACGFPPMIAAKATTMRHYCTSEEIYSMRTYAHRYQPYTPFDVAANTTYAPVHPYPIELSDPTPVNLPVWSLFRFFRGAVRLRFWTKVPSTTGRFSTQIVSSTDDNLDNDESDSINVRWVTLGAGNPFTYVEIPYNSNARYYKVPDAADERGITIDSWKVSTLTAMVTHVAAGDDISFGALRPLQPFSTASAQRSTSSSSANS